MPDIEQSACSGEFDPYKFDGAEVLAVDPLLEPYKQQLIDRWSAFKYQLSQINQFASLTEFSDYRRYGFYFEFENGELMNICEFDQEAFDGHSAATLVFREWIGNATRVSVIGDFNNWDINRNTSTQQDFGVFVVKIPCPGKKCPIPEGSKYKIYIETHDGQKLYRHPQHCLYAQFNPSLNQLEPVWCQLQKTESVPLPLAAFSKVLRIYEVHVGMSSAEAKVSSYREFADEILPKVVAKHYNAIQLMAIQEHAYYGSFGYQVTSFFAPSSRFGPPCDFAYLVRKAHSLGIIVLLDLVHSHASKNEADGVARYDGSDFLFLREDHPLWDSKVFNYSHIECLRFLMQNLSFWLDCFDVDGFRFDGCMSMLYWHRSAGAGYTGRYGEYFDEGCRVDVGALTYLRLAHLLFAQKYGSDGCGALPTSRAPRPKQILTIAEDVSGYPTLATPLCHGGVGFAYRFQMAVPDLWIQMMKGGFDKGLNDAQAVDMKRIQHALCNRRHQERHICYCECHDQALVGDKTLLMWLLDEKIYTEMALGSCDARTLRGVRVHKLIRLLTIGLGGEGYLTFFGNEFGHPEWIDFPRAGNGQSLAMCRRQWQLEAQEYTKYPFLSRFDVELMKLDEQYEWQRSREYVVLADNQAKLMAWDRGSLLFVVSLNPVADEYVAVVPLRFPGTYRLVLTTNRHEFGESGTGIQQGERLASRNYAELPEWQQKQLNGQQQCLGLRIQKQQGYVFARE